MLSKAKSFFLNEKIIQQVRYLNIHEHQSLSLFRDYKITVPRGCPAATPRAAADCALSLGDDVDYVVKAQVLAGGRGMGFFKENNFQGGVHVCESIEQVKQVASKMLGHTIVTKQTGPEGKLCGEVLVCERFYIRKERYFAIVNDRASGGPVLIGSSVGGTSIEEIAERHPNSILKLPLDIEKGLSDDEARKFAEGLGFTETKLDQAAQTIGSLYKLFIERDCTLLEINPFAETHDGRVIVCDAKINFDDNAKFRQASIHDLRDVTQEDDREIQASRYDLNYVGLDGDIGCLVNGAGLAMATMDVIKLNGGNPANFLDVGGGATRRQVLEAFRILHNDPKVQSILVNIFGGIMRCDIISLGIIAASQELGIAKPLVVRLEGTNKDQAMSIIEDSGLRMQFTDDLNLAAKRAVKMAEIVRLAKSANLDISFNL
eukprot:GHVL01023189.1.p1 GENE.GHVL01023189.1~~GHVL01023189.1.p1  ORF type:complete len:432 (+),score=74.42 GHVL01023189.1:68-1363(+)